MDIEERLNLIKDVGEEIITEQDLIKLLKEKKRFITYDGFEPSGTNIHIGQGLLRAINVNKMIKAGAHFKMLVADWHGWANNKMGGDLERIQKVGQFYIDVWKACGMDLKNVEFIWASDLLNNRDYWKTVMQIARNSTLKRIIRCGQIMGRRENEVLQASQIFYPCMQCADIFHLKADITQLGMDQRKVNMLAREIGPKIGYWKPVVVSHHMLMGLQKPVSKEKDILERTIELKMSKSKPKTAIFMTDTKEEIINKITDAWCPEKEVKENPILEYCRYIIFEKVDSIEIKRPEKWGGNLTIKSYRQLEEIYEKGELHPLDLKKEVAKKINMLVSPAREQILTNPKTKELYEEIKKYEVTR
ncbi:tyrosine--tRNA ligase [Candidatus Woesearchaeota archaeon]|nr:tyrosine--tRNA ligase [Candidatus Woesearchaeota archaeon]